MVVWVQNLAQAGDPVLIGLDDALFGDVFGVMRRACIRYGRLLGFGTQPEIVPEGDPGTKRVGSGHVRNEVVFSSRGQENRRWMLEAQRHAPGRVCHSGFFAFCAAEDGW
jgi:hypothetical protein